MTSPGPAQGFEVDYSAVPDTSGAAMASSACGHDALRQDEDFRAELLTMIPQVNAFAWSLTRSRDHGEDLAQEALAKAWQYRRTFRPGTNLGAWLFTIARNEFYSRRRRAWRQAPYDQAAAESIPSNGVDQIWAVDLSDTVRALRSLPHSLREALILVGARGHSYEEAARICDCPVGTAKSRVSRARRGLLVIVNSTPSADKARTRPQISSH